MSKEKHFVILTSVAENMKQRINVVALVVLLLSVVVLPTCLLT